MANKASDECYTPAWILDLATEILGEIGTDPCWSPSSSVVARHVYTIEADGLERPWSGPVWCNPPYSNPGPWLRRCAEHSGPALALIKADTSTRWWNSWVWAPAKCVAFIRKRVRFDGPYARSKTAPFPSALVYYGGDRCRMDFPAMHKAAEVIRL